MASHHVLGNGNLLLNFTAESNLTDLYFPHVGFRNHVAGHLCGIAVISSHHTRWLGADWKREGKMLPGSMVSRIRYEQEEAGLVLVLTKAVHPRENIFLVSIELENLGRGAAGENGFAVAFYHNFRINEHEIGDTAAYLPDVPGLLHYKEDVYLLAMAREENGASFRRWAIGRRDGSATPSWESVNWRSFPCEGIRQGDVDSVVVLDLECPPGRTAAGDYSLVAGRNLEEVRGLAFSVRERGVPALLEQTHLYGQEWRLRAKILRGGPDGTERTREREAYERSLFVVRSQCDNGGGIIAANDTGVLRFNGDHYSYVWPRDAALIARILLRQGFSGIAERFLSFCGKIVSPDGAILHKFRADGSLGSSWHGWWHDGREALPVQEDEIALPVLALADYFFETHKVEQVMEFYRAWGAKCLDFLCRFVDEQTGLPKPSHDLWEERYGVHAFTVAAVWRALVRAGEVARRLGFPTTAEKCFERADAMREAFLSSFWSEEHGLFARMIAPDGTRDFTPDSSTHAIWYFEMIPLGDPRLQRAMATTWDRLRIRTAIGGMARYYDDYYHRSCFNLEEAPGNPWVISTLWGADWYRRNKNYHESARLLQCVLDRQNEMGLLAEQWDPHTGAPLSVCPLTWSHAVLIEYLGSQPG